MIPSPCSKESAASSAPCIRGYCTSQCLGELTSSHKHDRPNATTTTVAFRERFAQCTKSSIFPHTHFTNHESLPSLADAFSSFADAYPHYRDTRNADRIRESEYPHLAQNVCLDYTGLSLFARAQLQHSPLFNISYNSSGRLPAASHDVQEPGGIESAMRNRIMSFLNISDEDYAMAFTANKTTAFRLLAETYPFRSNRRLLTVYEYESEAADAMAECAARRGAVVTSASFSWPSLRIDSAKLKRILIKKRKRGLLVFPLQSGMTGTRHPYSWMRLAQENGWHVLLDASALGPKDTDTLGLSLIQPDFVICSFFKLVGENPSGFAAVFVKKQSSAVLEASSATGAGIVSIVPARRASCQLDDFSGTGTGTLSEWETVSSLTSAPARDEEIVCEGLDHADSLGLVLISCRLRCLTNWLVTALTKLQHPYSESGRSPLVRIYGPRAKFDRGPAMAFNVFDWKGEKVEPVLVQKLADRSNISLSCGFLRSICFPEKHGLDEATATAYVRRKRRRESIRISVVNASLSFVSNFEDAYRLWSFVANFLDADFAEKERWRYMALNQKMVEV